MTITTKTNEGWLINVTVPDRTTWEDLECELYTTAIKYGDKIIMAGYRYNPEGPCFFGATYEFTDDDHTPEGFVGLVAVSRVSFEDEGHALEWAMQQ